MEYADDMYLIAPIPPTACEMFEKPAETLDINTKCKPQLKNLLVIRRKTELLNKP